jgi:hypothetical protein
LAGHNEGLHGDLFEGRLTQGYSVI